VVNQGKASKTTGGGAGGNKEIGVGGLCENFWVSKGSRFRKKSLGEKVGFEEENRIHGGEQEKE